MTSILFRVNGKDQIWTQICLNLKPLTFSLAKMNDFQVLMVESCSPADRSYSKIDLLTLL